MSITKETTARNPSVGADGGQPSKTHTLSIAETEEEFNENFVESQGFFRRLQRTQDPDFLNTVHNQKSGEPGLGTGSCRDGALEGAAGSDSGGGGKAGHTPGSPLGGQPHRTGHCPGPSRPEQPAHPASERKSRTADGGIWHRLREQSQTRRSADYPPICGPKCAARRCATMRR